MSHLFCPTISLFQLLASLFIVRKPLHCMAASSLLDRLFFASKSIHSMAAYSLYGRLFFVRPPLHCMAAYSLYGRQCLCFFQRLTWPWPIAPYTVHVHNTWPITSPNNERSITPCSWPPLTIGIAQTRSFMHKTGLNRFLLCHMCEFSTYINSNICMVNHILHWTLIRRQQHGIAKKFGRRRTTDQRYQPTIDWYVFHQLTFTIYIYIYV